MIALSLKIDLIFCSFRKLSITYDDPLHVCARSAVQRQLPDLGDQIMSEAFVR